MRTRFSSCVGVQTVYPTTTGTNQVASEKGILVHPDPSSPGMKKAGYDPIDLEKVIHIGSLAGIEMITFDGAGGGSGCKIDNYEGSCLGGLH